VKVTKTAVSIPADIFRAADVVAKRLGMSRSALYAKALAAFVAEQGGADVTKLLDKVYAKEASGLDPGLLRAQTASLSREDW
jgi:hypothetical protein